MLSGAHARLDGPVAGETYVAGLDVAGEAIDTAREGHDATVLTIGFHADLARHHTRTIELTRVCGEKYLFRKTDFCLLEDRPIKFRPN